MNALQYSTRLLYCTFSAIALPTSNLTDEYMLESKLQLNRKLTKLNCEKNCLWCLLKLAEYVAPRRYCGAVLFHSFINQNNHRTLGNRWTMAWNVRAHCCQSHRRMKPVSICTYGVRTTHFGGMRVNICIINEIKWWMRIAGARIAYEQTLRQARSIKRK